MVAGDRADSRVVWAPLGKERVAVVLADFMGMVQREALESSM